MVLVVELFANTGFHTRYTTWEHQYCCWYWVVCGWDFCYAEVGELFLPVSELYEGEGREDRHEHGHAMVGEQACPAWNGRAVL
jgi:hypothetical protein